MLDVPLFARRPRHLPLAVPRPDGTGWPDPSDVGRPSFDALTFYELGCRFAFEPESHDLAEQLVDTVLPHLSTGATVEDAPYLRKVFTTAARIGAGVGRQERGLSTPDLDSVDRRIAGALLQGRRKLPVMREDWTRLGAYFLLAGYYVGRTSPMIIELLVEEIHRPAADDRD